MNGISPIEEAPSIITKEAAVLRKGSRINRIPSRIELSEINSWRTYQNPTPPTADTDTRLKAIDIIVPNETRSTIYVRVDRINRSNSMLLTPTGTKRNIEMRIPAIEAIDGIIIAIITLILRYDLLLIGYDSIVFKVLSSMQPAIAIAAIIGIRSVNGWAIPINKLYIERYGNVET